MVFRGTYDAINDVHRPYVTVRVRSAAGVWVPLPLLIDTGADATVLDASCLLQMGLNPGVLAEQTASGVGGKSAYVPFPTELRFESSEGTKVFTGIIGIFTAPEACDTPMLGRDVLDSFRVIVDWGRKSILLLSAPHDYDVIVQ